jgi:hypothetical protein
LGQPHMDTISNIVFYLRTLPDEFPRYTRKILSRILGPEFGGLIADHLLLTVGVIIMLILCIHSLKAAKR